MTAYSELYIDDAAENLGEYLDFMVNHLKYDCDYAMSIFAFSKVGRQFENGNVKFVTGMSGKELANYTINQVTGKWICEEDMNLELSVDRSREYWAGWSIAQYQWAKCCTFKQLIEKGITISRIVDNYILHEADLTKFFIWCDEIYYGDKTENLLKRLRMYARLTQKQLSEKSGVTLRMIQLYEQGQNDLSKAGADTVISLSKVLNCRPEQLVDL